MRRIEDDRGRNAATSVLDLASGKGGDLLKWRKAHIKTLVCAGKLKLPIAMES